MGEQALPDKKTPQPGLVSDRLCTRMIPVAFITLKWQLSALELTMG